MRLAWFSPMPPVPSGIAACSADLVAGLEAEHRIDVFVDEPVARLAAAARPRLPWLSAHEFQWRHRADPYDLTVYQVGNSSHHDFLWPYLFRYPGLTVLHDAHLHHARAAALLRTKRPDHYRAEFIAGHPGVSADLAELAIAGFDSLLLYEWPMTRLIARSSRLVAVHAPSLAAQLHAADPDAAVAHIRLGHGDRLSDADAAAMRHDVRARYTVPEDAVVFGIFGGLTPEKRIPQALDAFQALLPYAPRAHLLLAGAEARHYDVAGDVRQRGLEPRVTRTGYIEAEAELTACIAACDVALSLRWPTARELSGPWLRALGAGRATVIMDLEHLADVPSLDPRTWTRHDGGDAAGAVTVAIDVMDEAHSLRLAMRRLAADAELRTRLGSNARDWWQREHSRECMLEDYRRILAAAHAREVPRPELPAHLRNDGDRQLAGLLMGFGVPNPLRALAGTVE